MWIWDDYIHDCIEMFHSDENDNYVKGSIAAGNINLKGKENLIIATDFL